MSPRLPSQTVEVWADWQQLGGATKVGILSAEEIRGREIASFTYSPSWLTGPRVQIDPRLPLYEGTHYPIHRQFGVFEDTSPDRWGRTLLDRREAHVARAQRRPRRRLSPFDYLLGVFDGNRMGGLRFRRKDGPYLDDDHLNAAPPWTSLSTLQHASQQLEAHGAEDQKGYDQWLTMLLAPGTSLGGARPKAGVLDPNGHPWIGKFPSVNDSQDVGAWEWVASRLAALAGIQVPETKIARFGGHKHHTFLSRRFDRVGRERLHFSSAMTQLEQRDGDVDPRIGYVDIAAFLAQHGATPETDMAELWRRIAFSVCISNTDDHLRNHGFLFTQQGWRLSPAYDLNPNPDRFELSLPYDGVNTGLDLELVREAGAHFRLSPSEIDAALIQITSAVRSWRTVAAEAGLAKHRIEAMADAFRVAT